jgi:ketosteroid isomerase-like protein
MQQRWFSVSSPLMENGSDLAREAMDRFRQGMATGSWKPFIELLAPDFTMRVPVGELRGHNAGREEAVQHFSKLRLMRVRLSLGEPTTETTDGRTTIFELEVTGTLYGRPYRNHLAFAFDVEGGKVRAMREYFGDLDSEIVSKALTEETSASA